MITRSTKIQLMVFVLITLLGVSYVGARYAKLGRLVSDTTYTVTADFAKSGGIFTGAEVTYRGVTVGTVEDMDLSGSGVDVQLGIDNDHDTIPADVTAVVADKSAVGEQYVDLQPHSRGAPYLEDGAQIPRADTKTPISATTLLVDLDQLVNSVDKDNLRTVVSELGQAFEGTGPELGRIIDTSNSFIKTASRNLGVTKRLIKHTSAALQTQVNSESAIRSFTKNLSLLTDTLVSSDQDLRDVIDKGSKAASDVRQLIIDNRDDLAGLINNLITTGEITSAHIPGIRQILVIYPYVVRGGYTVIVKDPLSGMYDAHFGLVLTQEPVVCHHGYEGTDQRTPYKRKEVPMNVDAHCAEPQTQTSARGAQHAPAYNRAPVVAKYDPATQTLTPASQTPGANKHATGGQQKVFGKDAWKWLLLGPLAAVDR
ncbi:MAG: MCE family protein [Nocardioidaceae bacterium]